MTQTPETPITKVEQLEAALGKFAQLSFQNATRHDTEIAELRALSKETTQSVRALVAEGAEQRQQAAIDRQEFRTEIRQIWEYLRDRNGGSSPPQS